MSPDLESIRHIILVAMETILVGTFYTVTIQEGKSTVTQLLEIYHKLCKAVDEN